MESEKENLSPQDDVSGTKLKEGRNPLRDNTNVVFGKGGGGHSNSPKAPQPKASEIPNQTKSEAHLCSNDDHDVVSPVSSDSNPKPSGAGTTPRSRDNAISAQQIPENRTSDYEGEDDEKFEDAEEIKSNLTLLAEDLNNLHLGTPVKIAETACVVHEFIDTRQYEVNSLDLSGSDLSFESYDANYISINNTFNTANSGIATPINIGSSEQIHKSEEIESYSEDKKTNLNLSMNSSTSTEGNTCQENNEERREFNIANKTTLTPPFVHKSSFLMSCENNLNAPKVNVNNTSIQSSGTLEIETIEPEEATISTEMNCYKKDRKEQESDKSYLNLNDETIYKSTETSGSKKPMSLNSSVLIDTEIKADQTNYEGVKPGSNILPGSDLSKLEEVSKDYCFSSEINRVEEKCSDPVVVDDIVGVNFHSEHVIDSLTVTTTDESMFLANHEEKNSESLIKHTDTETTIIVINETPDILLELSNISENNSLIPITTTLPEKESSAKEMFQLEGKLSSLEVNHTAEVSCDKKQEITIPTSDGNVITKVNNNSIVKITSSQDVADNAFENPVNINSVKEQTTEDKYFSSQINRISLEDIPSSSETIKSLSSSNEVLSDKHELEVKNDIKSKFMANEHNFNANDSLSDQAQILSSRPEQNITINLYNSTSEKFMLSQDVVDNASEMSANVHSEGEKIIEHSSQRNRTGLEHVPSFGEEVETPSFSSVLSVNTQEREIETSLKSEIMENVNYVSANGSLSDEAKVISPGLKENITELDNSNSEKLSAQAVVNNTLEMSVNVHSEGENIIELSGQSNRTGLEDVPSFGEEVESPSFSSVLSVSTQEREIETSLKSEIMENVHDVSANGSLSDEAKVISPGLKENITELDNSNSEKLSAQAVVNNTLEMSVNVHSEGENIIELSGQSNRTGLEDVPSLGEEVESPSFSSVLSVSTQEREIETSLKSEIMENVNYVSANGSLSDEAKVISPGLKENITELDNSNSEKLSAQAVVNNTLEMSVNVHSEGENIIELSGQSNRTGLEDVPSFGEEVESPSFSSVLSVSTQEREIETSLKSEIMENVHDVSANGSLSDEAKVISPGLKENITELDNSNSEKLSAQAVVNNTLEMSVNVHSEGENIIELSGQSNRTGLEDVPSLGEEVESPSFSSVLSVSTQEREIETSLKSEIMENVNYVSANGSLSDEAKVISPGLKENITELDNSNSEKLSAQAVVNNILEMSVNVHSEGENIIELSGQSNRTGLEDVQSFGKEVESPSFSSVLSVSTQEREIETSLKSEIMENVHDVSANGSLSDEAKVISPGLKENITELDNSNSEKLSAQAVVNNTLEMSVNIHSEGENVIELSGQSNRTGLEDVPSLGEEVESPSFSSVLSVSTQEREIQTSLKSEIMENVNYVSANGSLSDEAKVISPGLKENITELDNSNSEKLSAQAVVNNTLEMSVNVHSEGENIIELSGQSNRTGLEDVQSFGEEVQSPSFSSVLSVSTQERDIETNLKSEIMENVNDVSANGSLSDEAKVISPGLKENITELDNSNSEKLSAQAVVNNTLEMSVNVHSEGENIIELSGQSNRTGLEDVPSLGEEVESPSFSSVLSVSTQEREIETSLKSEIMENVNYVSANGSLSDEAKVISPGLKENITELDNSNSEKLSAQAVVNNILEMSVNVHSEGENIIELSGQSNRTGLEDVQSFGKEVESPSFSSVLSVSTQEREIETSLKSEIMENVHDVSANGSLSDEAKVISPGLKENITELDNSNSEKLSAQAVVNNTLEMSVNIHSEGENVIELSGQSNRTGLEDVPSLGEEVESPSFSSVLSVSTQEREIQTSLKSEIMENVNYVSANGSLSDEAKVISPGLKENITELDNSNSEKLSAQAVVNNTLEMSVNVHSEGENIIELSGQSNRTGLEDVQSFGEEVQSPSFSSVLSVSTQERDIETNLKSEIMENVNDVSANGSLSDEAKVISPGLKENITELDNSNSETLSAQAVVNNTLEMSVNIHSEGENIIGHSGQSNRTGVEHVPSFGEEVESPSFSSVVSLSTQEHDIKNSLKSEIVGNENNCSASGLVSAETRVGPVSNISNEKCEPILGADVLDLGTSTENIKSTNAQQTKNTNLVVDSKLEMNDFSNKIKLDVVKMVSDFLVPAQKSDAALNYYEVNEPGSTVYQSTSCTGKDLCKIEPGATSSFDETKMPFLSAKPSLEEMENKLYSEFTQSNIKIDQILSKYDAVLSPVTDHKSRGPLTVDGKEDHNIPNFPKSQLSKTNCTNSKPNVSPKQTFTRDFKTVCNTIQSNVKGDNIEFLIAGDKEAYLKFDERLAEEAANVSDHILSLSDELQDSDSDGDNNKTVITVTDKDSKVDQQPSNPVAPQTIITKSPVHAHPELYLKKSPTRRENDVFKSRRLFSPSTISIEAYMQSMRSVHPTELNQSEAGPITADELSTQDLEFQDGANLDLDYFTTAGNTQPVTNSSLTRDSLYVKFDPIVGAIVSQTVSDSFAMPPPLTAKGETHISEEQLQPEEASLGHGQGEPQRTPGRTPALEAVQKLISLTPPSASSGTPIKTPSTGTKTERGSVGSPNSVAPSPRIASEQLQRELTKIEEMMKDQQLSFEAELEKERTRVSELAAQAKVAAERELRLKKELEDRTKSRQKLSLVMEEYEKTISQLVTQKEEEKKEFEVQKELLMKERDTAMQHLNNMEIAFSDVHQKYERSKTVIEGMKANEDVLKKSLAEYDEVVKSCNSKYDSLKSHAVRQLDTANTELDLIRRSHQVELAKLKAMLKKAEVRVTTLEESLERKSKENQELAAICDELISKVGGAN